MPKKYIVCGTTLLTCYRVVEAETAEDARQRSDAGEGSAWEYDIPDQPDSILGVIRTMGTDRIKKGNPDDLDCCVTIVSEVRKKR